VRGFGAVLCQIYYLTVRSDVLLPVGYGRD